jgi:membrane protease subunit HflC
LDDILGNETRNAVAKHELIEIIRTSKDRVPLRGALLKDAELRPFPENNLPVNQPL